MRAGIVYFSQTGNTQKVAEAIQERLVNILGSCDLHRLEQTDPAVIDRYQLLGLGCPVFYFREPINVRKFLLDLTPLMKGEAQKPVFFFVTHGGTPGDVFARLDRLARNRNLKTLGWFSCLGVDTFPPYADRDPPIACGHPDQKDLDRAKVFAAEMALRARALLKGEKPKRPDIPGNIITRLFSSLFSARALRTMERYGLLPRKVVYRSHCNRCGLCLQSCPQSIIRLDGYPVISNQGCIYCYHCHRICPQQAIVCNWLPLRIVSGHYLRQIFSSLRQSRRPS